MATRKAFNRQGKEVSISVPTDETSNDLKTALRNLTAENRKEIKDAYYQAADGLNALARILATTTRRADENSSNDFEAIHDESRTIHAALRSFDCSDLGAIL